MERKTIERIKREAGDKVYRQRLPQWNGSGQAKCPKHSPDSHPSLSIYSKGGVWYYKCYVCSQHNPLAKGDVFKFLQWLDGLSFLDAVKRTAHLSGIELEEVEEREPIEYGVAENAKRLPEVLEFLKSRGISRKVAESRLVGAVDFPGVGKMVAMPYESGAPKLRAIEPKNGDRFRHIKDRPTVNELYGLEYLDLFDFTVFVTESELDTLMLISHGYPAVSVTSASSVVNDDGSLKIKPEHMERLPWSEVFIVTDMDAAGEKCAEAFQRVLPVYSTFRIKWPYSKGASGPEGAKDVGEFYALDPSTFKERFNALIGEAKRFRTVNGFRYEPMALPAFLERTFEPPKQLLGPVIREKDINQIYASRGMGKSFVALGMGLSLASGVPFLKWPVETPQDVLYVDGEMSGYDLQNRLAGLTAGLGNNADVCMFHPMNFDAQSSGPVPDIATLEGQRVIEDMIGVTNSKVLILDNLSCLAQIPDNDDEAWLPVGAWLLNLRRKGITTLLVHHAGKNGTQRGISRREDQLNTVIKLSNSDEWSPTDGLHVTLIFEKTRSFHGKDAESLDVRLMNGEGDRLVWAYKPAYQSKFDRFKELHDAGATKEEIMQTLEVKKSMYYDYLRRAEKELTLVTPAA